MQYDISVREVEPRVVLARHVLVDEVDLGSTIGGTFGEAYEFMRRHGIEPAGPPFVVYHRQQDGGRWEADICAPVSRMAPDTPPGFVFQTIAGGLVATTLHRGPYATLTSAYTALGDWTKDHGYRFAGPPRELYMSEPDVPQDEIETVVEWPVVLADAPVGAAV
jgi:effector-binding domain-containing protein